MSQALKLYKQLHRTSQRVFQGDPVALSQFYLKLREEYDKNRHVSNENSVNELLKFGQDVNTVLSKKVVQLEKVDEARYKANLRPEFDFGTNTPFRSDVTEEEYRKATRSSKKKCK